MRRELLSINHTQSANRQRPPPEANSCLAAGLGGSLPQGPALLFLLWDARGKPHEERVPMETPTLGTAVSHRPAAAVPRSASGPASEPAGLHSWGCSHAGRSGSSNHSGLSACFFLAFVCMFVCLFVEVTKHTAGSVCSGNTHRRLRLGGIGAVGSYFYGLPTAQL